MNLKDLCSEEGRRTGCSEGWSSGPHDHQDPAQRDFRARL